jgi:uncharacterized membrane protein YfcA
MAAVTSVLPLIACGFGAGILSGLLGVGGGVVMVPLLVLVAHQSQHHAHATSLAAVVLIGAAGALTFGVDGEVDIGLAALLAAGSLVGAPLGARVMARTAEGNLKTALGAFLVVAAGLMLSTSGGSGSDVVSVTVPIAVGIVAFGVVVGVLSAMFGIGGGIAMVPFMVLVLGEGQHLAEGTSLLVMIPTAIAGVIAHRKRGYVSFKLAGWLAIGGIVGTVLGARLALEIDGDRLRMYFAVFLAVMGLRLVIRGRRTSTP